GDVAFALHHLRQEQQRRQAEAALRESEAYLSTTLHSIGDAVIVVDLSSNVVLVNPAAQALTGWGPEAIGRPLREVFHIVDARTRQPAESPIDRVLAEGIVVGLANHTALIARDGTERQIADSAAPIQGEDGRVMGVVLVFRDVTEAYRRSEALRESERQYRSLFEALGEGFALHEIICDEDGTPCDYRFLEVNPAFERFTGLERDRIVGRTAREVLPGIESYWIDTYGKVALTGEPVQFQNYSGELKKHFEVIAFSPDPGRFATLFVNISEQVNAQEALQNERDFANSLVDNAQAIVLVLDDQGYIVRFNRFAQELTGCTEHEARGQRWTDRFTPQAERKDCRERFGRVLAGETVRGEAGPVLGADGREVLVRWYLSPLRDAQGHTTNVLAVGHDITEIRQKEQQLRQAVKMEAIGHLAGGVAHDFNNMLAIIQGYADLLSAAMDSEHEFREDVDKIRAAARRAAGLTRQLLALGRRQVMKPQVLQLPDVLAEMESMLTRTLGEDMELAVSADEGLWRVRVDPTAIEEVLLNLAVNAREAMPEGGRLAIEAANVTLPAPDPTYPDAAAGDYVMLTVADTGTGMTPEVREQAFEPFFTTKRAAGGTGLGLSVCYGIITQSGGHVAVESAPGEGTTFRILLPRCTEVPAAKAATAPAEAGAEELPRGTETVLVVEDEEDVRHLIVRVLRQCGYTVLETGNSREAIPLGEHYAEDIHLMVSDVIMPGMSGRRLAARLAPVRPSMKVMFISGYTEFPDVDRERTAIQAEFVAKPFSPRLLAETVRRVLDAPKSPDR
ncbi:hypothetical protein LCGC14_1886150, partial [marine sediment metagenome]